MGLTEGQLQFNDRLGDGRGWLGDVKSLLLGVTKLKGTGWTPKFNSRRAIQELSNGNVLPLKATGDLIRRQPLTYIMGPVIPQTGEV